MVADRVRRGPARARMEGRGVEDNCEREKAPRLLAITAERRTSARIDPSSRAKTVRPGEWVWELRCEAKWAFSRGRRSSHLRSARVGHGEARRRVLYAGRLPLSVLLSVPAATTGHICPRRTAVRDERSGAVLYLASGPKAACSRLSSALIEVRWAGRGRTGCWNPFLCKVA